MHYASRYYASPVIANIGIGDGYLELSAHRRGWEVISVDPDESAVNQLLAHDIDARRGTIEQLPLDSVSVDIVFASELFEHLKSESLSAGLAEIKRVLKPNGRLIGTVPFQENLIENECVCPRCQLRFHRWGHEQSFALERVRSVLGAVLDVEVCQTRYFPSWKRMNLRGKIHAALRIAILNPFGIHGQNENILFIAQRSS